VQEAGGLISDLHGNNTHMNTGNVLAANPKVFKEMLKRLHPVMQKY
jgi:myo-inositol-1(or 4)-monophosphatase